MYTLQRFDIVARGIESVQLEESSENLLLSSRRFALPRAKRIYNCMSFASHNEIISCAAIN